MKIEFTKDEATALNQLIDLAVKAGGLNVAEASVILSRKIVAAIQEDAQPKPAEAEKITGG